ncbi:MAG TPA: amino acid permease [Vicinamibacterales bacterium]|nr:amino acid permease [Vicinamibacterales bacterium]
MLPSPPAAGPQLTRAIGLTQATAMVVGTIIGTSIFVQPSEITREVPTIAGILVAWTLAGALTFLGAIVCAELASAFPQTGGVYVFLREAFSTRVAFMWGWANFWSIHSGIIAAIAVVCARYIAFFVDLSPFEQQLTAAGVIAAISAINYVGVRTGTTVQTVITGAKLAAIVVLLVAGVAYSGAGGGDAWTLTVADVATVPLDRMLLGVGAGLFAFGGWHMVTYAAGETTDPVRTLPRALTIGTLVVTACYIGLNAVYLYVLPLDAVRQSPRIAADVAQLLVGQGGASAVSALVVISAIGALTGIILAGPRMYLSMAQDGVMVPWAGVIHPVYRTPHRAIVLQGVWASVLVLTGSYPTLFGRVIYMEWFFFALMTAGVFVLRGRASYQPAYRMWAYPAAPILFILASAAIVVNQLRAQPAEALFGAAVVATGWPVALWVTRRRG